MSKSTHRITVGITMGDPSGIGPAIIRKALYKLRNSRLAQFVIIGDKWVFNQASGFRLQASGIRFIDLNNVPRKNFSFGKIKAEYGRASMEYVDKAIELIKSKKIDCLVTCPVSKETINLGERCGFLGHTEYLAKQTNTKNFAMMLLNRKLKFSLVTRHIPLKEVPAQLKKNKICQTILLTRQSLKKLFLIKEPRIVVCGLNPHASDNGLIGLEENKIIKPALSALRRLRQIDGPLPADTAVLGAAQKQYDCVIAMYHDQALIPLKISDAYAGVNITLGLKFIRTSPLHGTAFDIAGRYNLINPISLIEAVKLAVECTSNQKRV